MLLRMFKAGFAHGLLIMAAPESTDSHDDWDAATEVVHAGPDSIYCGVMDQASGLVEVSCCEDEEPDPDMATLYSGELHLPSKRLTLYDPNQTVVMQVPAPSDRVTVVVQADDDSEAQDVRVILAAIE